MQKVEVARRQLGTALALFLDDLDPVSVHSLACAGCEIADHLAKSRGRTAFSEHALSAVPNLDAKTLASLRAQYWNAFKHANERGGRERDDEELLSKFSDEQNDDVLFIGWYDLAEAINCLPIEVQVFQIWYFAKYPDKLNVNFPATEILAMFPKVRELPRNVQKQRLRTAITRARRQKDVMNDPRTERRSLILKS